MWHDPIVAEVRRNREQYAARFNCDVNAIDPASDSPPAAEQPVGWDEGRNQRSCLYSGCGARIGHGQCPPDSPSEGSWATVRVVAGASWGCWASYLSPTYSGCGARVRCGVGRADWAAVGARGTAHEVAVAG